jgi:DNA-binding winged helix-turn-helix (wHTH) protein/tetratricopeptide (TPR) repeat protein
MLYVFDDYALDLQCYELRHAGQRRPLEPQAFNVLVYLLQHRHRVVPKAELLERLWPGQYVGEATLAHRLMGVRRALGDSGRSQRLIKTVHGRGYRFVAAVQECATASDTTAQTAVPVPSALPPRPAPVYDGPRRCRPSMVGRQAELAQLQAWATQAFQGTRQVVLVSGEPGIGKTTVVQVLLHDLAAGTAVRVGQGQCIEHYGPGEAYMPVLEALERLGRGPAGPHLRAVLYQYAPTWLAQMPGLLTPAEREALQRETHGANQGRMLRELAGALEVFTAEHALVLVLEDLHWSDRATLEWLASVARRSDPARLLILGTYRPVDAFVQAHPLRTVLTELQQHGQCRELVLDYLSEAAITAYLCQRFGTARLAAALTRVLHQRTQGNPLFLITLVDELIRQQVVREGPAGWTMQGGGETIPMIIPATLREMIEHQLAHCSPEDQTLLAAASVAGVEFAAAAVAAGLERPADAIEAQCATLAHQGQFLQARGQAEWPDGTVTACFGFRHTLYQDVVYQRIPAGRQTCWHARIGVRLVQGFGAQAGDLAAALARHFVRGRLLPVAVSYLRQAGQTTAGRGAHQEAIAYYEQALHALQQLPPTPDRLAQAIDLRLDLRNALLPLGAYQRILDYLREAEAGAHALADQRRLGWVSSYLSRHFWVVGNQKRALTFGQRALAIAEQLEDDTFRFMAQYHLGTTYLVLGDYRQAIAYLRQNVAALGGARLYQHFALAGLPSVVARTWLVWCLAELGAFAEARARGDEAIGIAEAVEHPYSLSMAYYGVGFLHLCQGELQQAIARLERALGICQAAMIPDLFPALAAFLGRAYCLAGRGAEALSLLEQAVAQAAAMRHMMHQALRVGWLSEAYLRAGRLDEAWAQAQWAFECAQTHQERGHKAYALRLLGEVAAQRTPPDAAPVAAYYRQALTLADSLGMRPLQAHCHRSLGTLYAQLGQREQARTALSTAMNMYRGMAMTFWLPETEATRA